MGSDSFSAEAAAGLLVHGGFFRFLVRRLQSGRNGFQVAVYAHELLQDRDSLLRRLIHRLPGLLAILICLLLGLGEQLLTRPLGVSRACCPVRP